MDNYWVGVYIRCAVYVMVGIGAYQVLGVAARLVARYGS